MIVDIEKRLQDPPRFLMFPLDEAVALILPVMVGMMSQHLLIGLIVAFFVFSLWRRLKGEGGIELLWGVFYWYLPSDLGFFKPFPDSAIEVWQS